MAFQAPRKGDRIELGNKPGEYFLVDDVSTGQDARRQTFWQANVRDKNGQSRTLHSDQVPSWRHFKGPNNQWHDEMLAEREESKRQKQQESLRADFEAQHVFKDGMPLFVGMMIKVHDNAIGSLSLFAGERLLVKSVDMAAGMVTMSPVDNELGKDPGLMAELRAIPAKDVVSQADPAVGGTVWNDPVKLPDGTEVTAGDLVGMTPALNTMARHGHVKIIARVEPTNKRIVNGVEMDGEALFIRDMVALGVPEQSVQERTKYYRSPRQGGSWGAWSGDLRLFGEISEEAKAEIWKVADPSIKFWPNPEGIRVQSNALYRQMIILGVNGSRPSRGAGAEGQAGQPSAVAWVQRQCLFAKS